MTLSEEGDRSRFSGEGKRDLERALLRLADRPRRPGGVRWFGLRTRKHGTAQRRLVVTAVLSLGLRATAL